MVGKNLTRREMFTFWRPKEGGLVDKMDFPYGDIPFDRDEKSGLYLPAVGALALGALASKKDISRRDLLKYGTIFGATSILTGCGDDGPLPNIINPILDEPFFTGSYYSITRSGETGMELNDNVRFTVNGSVGTSANGVFTKFVAYLGSAGIQGIGEGTLNSSTSIAQNEIFLDRIASGTQDILVDYIIRLDNGTTKTGTGNAGSVDIANEQDYSWDSSSNQGIYDRRGQIADVLARNSTFFGRKLSKNDIVKTLESWYDPASPRAINTDLYDTAVGNNFVLVGVNEAPFSGLSEKDVYDLLRILS